MKPRIKLKTATFQDCLIVAGILLAATLAAVIMRVAK